MLELTNLKSLSLAACNTCILKIASLKLKIEFHAIVLFKS